MEQMAEIIITFVVCFGLTVGAIVLGAFIKSRCRGDHTKKEVE